MHAPSPQERAALISKSLVRLQERFGERFGRGDKVQLWHALDDLKRIADELTVSPSAPEEVSA